VKIILFASSCFIWNFCDINFFPSEVIRINNASDHFRLKHFRALLLFSSAVSSITFFLQPSFLQKFPSFPSFIVFIYSIGRSYSTLKSKHFPLYGFYVRGSRYIYQLLPWFYGANQSKPLCALHLIRKWLILASIWCQWTYALSCAFSEVISLSRVS